MKDSIGRWLTKALFVELTDKDMAKKYPPKLSLEEAKIIYLESMDPTEYTAATKIVGNWDHWQALLKSPPIMEHINKWRDELEIKIRSESIKQAIKIAGGDKGFQAAKWLADKGWEPKVAGRPSKAKIAHETKVAVGLREELADDAKRVLQ